MPDDLGPWRDGRYLVATTSSPMPQRCMICAAPVSALREEAIPLPRQRPAKNVVGAAKFLLGPRFTVKYGRCSAHRVRWSKGLGMLGGLSLLISMLGVVGCFIASNGRFHIGEVLFGLMFIASLAVLAWAHFRDLHLGRVDNEMVWVGGFREPYLSTLPEISLRK